LHQRLWSVNLTPLDLHFSSILLIKIGNLA